MEEVCLQEPGWLPFEEQQSQSMVQKQAGLWAPAASLGLFMESHFYQFLTWQSEILQLRGVLGQCSRLT